MGHKLLHYNIFESSCWNERVDAVVGVLFGFGVFCILAVFLFLWFRNFGAFAVRLRKYSVKKD